MAIDAHNVLLDPESRGLPGTIALTKLKRLLKKIPANDLPEQLRSLTAEKLAELREENLLASANLTLQKLDDQSADPFERLEWAASLKHYISKLNCGWQVVGLSQRAFISMQFSLYCDLIKEKAKDDFSMVGSESLVSRFLNDLLEKDEINEEDFKAYKEKLQALCKEIKDSLEQKATARVENIIDALNNENDISPEKTLKMINDARNHLSETGRDYEWMRDISDRLEEKREKANRDNYRVRYDAILSSMSGFEAEKNIQELETDMEYDRLSWGDIGVNDEDVQQKKTAFCYQGLHDKYETSKELLLAGKGLESYDVMRGVAYMLSGYDFSTIGKDVTEIGNHYKEVLKLHLKESFTRAFDPERDAISAVLQIGVIEDTLNREGMGWDDINPEGEMDLSSLYLRAAEQHVGNYLVSGNPGNLYAGASNLSTAQKPWEALGNYPELTAASQRNGHDLPQLAATGPS